MKPIDRYKMAWQMRKNGATWRKIAAHLQVSTERARQLALNFEHKLSSACNEYQKPVLMDAIYGVEHTFYYAPDGDIKRVGLAYNARGK